MKQDWNRALGLARKTTLAFAGAARTGLVLAGIAMLASAAQAQYRASLRGTVTDPSGAVVPGATITLTNTGTNQAMTATSDTSGIYSFNGLPPDHFSLKAEKGGFKTTTIAEVVPIPEQPNALNVQMELGGATQQVMVLGSAAPLLDTDTATTSATISSNQIQHLPSYNRDVFQLAQLAPGVFGDGSQQSGGGSYSNPGNQGPGGSGGGASGIFQTENGPQIQARGGQYETNGVSVDGISTVSAVWGGTSIITPSEDSVSDVKVVSNSYDAEVGRFSGGQIQVTSKSGTNDVHGSLFFKASRPGLNAYQRWNGTGSNKAGTPSDRGVNRDANRFNNYGGSLGGPIWKNRIFAFFNYETSPLSASTTAQGWYETPQFLASAAPVRQHRCEVHHLQRRGRSFQWAGPAYLRKHRAHRGGQLRDHPAGAGRWLAIEEWPRQTGSQLRRFVKHARYWRRAGWHTRPGILQHGQSHDHISDAMERTAGRGRDREGPPELCHLLGAGQQHGLQRPGARGQLLASLAGQRCIFSDLEPHIFPHSAEPGARQCCRLAVE